MEFITAALLILIIYLIVTSRSALDRKLDVLDLEMIKLKELLKKTIEDKENLAAKQNLPPAPKPVTEDKPRPVPIPEPVKPAPPKPVPAEPRPELQWDKTIFTPPDPKPAPPIYQAPEPKPSFFERHPDLEKFIGENLVNKIGIAILVLAIAYFVKFAIDNNWIGPVGRVGVGILCGSILIGFAHRLRKNYTAFSSVLAGGGLAIFYFTITLAFHQFHLFSQTVAFIILIVITIFAVALSLLYDKQELAIIALVGGMSSPFMVSTGHANYNAFFIYLLILNAGLLIIAYYKAWRILNISAFGLTVLVYIAVLFT